MSETKKVAVQDIVPRITQLDSLEFDSSIRGILLGHLQEVEKYLKPGLLNSIKPELELFVDILLLRNSIFKSGSTFGQQLLNLKYNRLLIGKKAHIYTVFTVIIPYLKRKYDASWRGESSTVRTTIDAISNVSKVAHLLNILAFLSDGVYPSLVERFLGLRHQLVQKLNRKISYNYMTRELLWHSFMELLMFTLPLINVQALKRRMRSLFARSTSHIQVAPPALSIATSCVICGFRPNIPSRVSLYCSHVACYICLKSHILADDKFLCPDCGISNTASSHFQYIRC